MQDEKNNLKNARKRRIKKIKERQESNFKIIKNQRGITLVALVITILFSYDEKIKSSNSKGFLLLTI